MATKLIVSPERLKLWLGLGEENEVPEGVLEESIRAAQSKIESVLDTPLQESSRVDVFEAGVSKWPIAGGCQKMLLSAGFAKEVVLRGVKTWNDPAGLEVAETEYVLEKELGVIIIGESLPYKYLRVEYTAGVTRQTAPEWLQISILAQAPLLFGLPDNMPDTRGAKNFKDQIAAMYGVHNRIVPFSKKAVASWLL